MDTELQAIPDFPDYAITRDGRIWSRPRRGTIKTGKWLKPYVRKTGYSAFQLQKDGKDVCRLLHRLLLETYVGPCPDGMQCRHLDGNPRNNNLDNLCWGTPRENTQDSIRHGTFMAGRPCRNGGCKGEQQWNSKLTRQDVRDIDALYRTQLFSRAKIAKWFGVSAMTVHRITSRKTWRWLWEAA